MLHKKRRRTRKITVLQKKEELLESSDLSSYNGRETLLETNSTEINNNNSCSSYHSQLSNSTEVSETTMMSAEQQAWRRRWKRPRGHSLWRKISPWRKSINLFTFGLLLISIFSYKVEVQGQPPPLPPAGFLDFDNLPVTRFSCEGKVIGGYYADVETGCQMFHVCTLGQKDEVQDIKFLCLNGTVFDQETRVCERVDEVDCSKAEQFFDLNLDLYVPHVATPKPPEQDLEEEDAIIRPVSTPKPTSSPPTTTTPRPTTTTKRPTTTATPRYAPTTTSTSSRTRLTTPQSPEATTTKGYSSFNYYLKTPHSHVSSGYNSQSRQSYIFNHKPNLEDEPEDNSGSYTVSENTARKIPSGPKTIVYTPSTSSSTSRPSIRGAASYTRNSISSTTTPAPPKLEELDEQYTADEYYEDEDYDVSSSTAGSQQPNSKQSSSSNSYEVEPRSKNSYSAQPQTQFRGKSSQSSYDFRDGRSTGPSKSSSSSSSSSSRGSKGGSESSVSVAVSRSKATISPPVITRPPTKVKVINVTTTTTTTTEEPYYYDDDYPEDEIAPQHQQPAIIVRGTSSSTSRSASGASSDSNRVDSNRSIKASSNSKSTAAIDTSGPSGPSEPTGTDADHSEYYDDGGDGQSLNVNDHHFTHVDVPRIPFAKPNVPRVLVTNGKPFLPRLRRQSIHHSVLSHQEQKDTVPMVDISSLWESLATEDETDDHHSHKSSPNIPFNSQSSSSRRRRNISHSLSKSKLNLEVSRASRSVIQSKSKPNQTSGVTKR